MYWSRMIDPDRHCTRMRAFLWDETIGASRVNGQTP